jgi:hypothetical protein
MYANAKTRNWGRGDMESAGGGKFKYDIFDTL